MALTINTNVSALTAQRNLSGASSRSASSLSKLSSGSRVPTAKEDAASLSIGTGLKLDVAAYRAAQTNAQQASSLLQIADGAFSQIGDILARMKTIATTAQSDQLSGTERGFLNTEYQQLSSEIDRIAATTEFNGVDLLDLSAGLVANTVGTDLSSTNGVVGFEFDTTKVTAGDVFEVAIEIDAGGTAGTDRLILKNNNTDEIDTVLFQAPTAGEGQVLDLNFAELGVTIKVNDQFTTAGPFTADFNQDFATGANVQFTTTAGTTPAASLDFQVGIGATTNDSITYNLTGGTVNDLFGGGAGDVVSTGNADTATAAIDTAVNSVNTARATIGATLNRLEFASSNLSVSIENTEAARSVLLDVDVSAEITKFTSEQVLIQAGVSLLAQANQQPGLLLRLLQ